MPENGGADITQMMSATQDVIVSPPPKKSKALWVVLGCVIFGVGLGVIVYQQSITPSKTTVKTTPKPSVAPAVPTVPTPTPTTPEINAVFPEPNTVAFPKAGELRVYYSQPDWLALKIDMTIDGKVSSVTIPAGAVTTPMKVFDTGIKLTAASTVSIKTTVLPGTQASNGWISPSAANKCGANGFALVDITNKINYAVSQAGGEPLVSKQCWTDYEPPKANGTPAAPDFNDYQLIWSYKPTAVTSSASPSPSASLSASPSPSGTIISSPSPAPSTSPTPKPSTVSPIPSPSPSATPTPTPSPSPRVVMPDTSGGTPVTGVFEVTVVAVSIGLIFLVIGLFGLMVL